MAKFFICLLHLIRIKTKFFTPHMLCVLLLYMSSRTRIKLLHDNFRYSLKVFAALEAVERNMFQNFLIVPDVWPKVLFYEYPMLRGGPKPPK